MDTHLRPVATAPAFDSTASICAGACRTVAQCGQRAASVQKCTAGAASREGTDSPLTHGSPGCPTDWAPALALPQPKRASKVHRRRCIFSARPAEAPRADMLRRKLTR